MLSSVQFRFNGVFFKTFFKVKLLIADLGAKSHMLNMYKFNGFYGCRFCTAPGKTIGRTHSYYPFPQTGKTREHDVNDMLVNYAELLPVDENINVAGVKGKSAFASMIDDLPLTAPVDYMHCVLLGVFPELLKHCNRALCPNDRTEVGLILSKLSCPREMVAYSRKIRSLDAIAQFKANEYFNWIFYISILVFRNRLPKDLYSHLQNLVFGVRLLFESSAATSTAAARILLNDFFCRDIVSMHGGNERIETINVHCLRHLVDQVQRFGPLYCYSAMSFESANRTLSDLFTGSLSQIEIICRRVLRRHKLARLEIKNLRLKKIFDKLSPIPVIDCVGFSDEMIETEDVKLGRSRYSGGTFFNRHHFNNTYFDSPSYKRSKLGNCFVSISGKVEKFGQIRYFIQMEGAPFFNAVHANVQLFEVVEQIGSVKGYFHRVEETNCVAFVPH